MIGRTLAIALAAVLLVVAGLAAVVTPGLGLILLGVVVLLLIAGGAFFGQLFEDVEKNADDQARRANDREPT